MNGARNRWLAGLFSAGLLLAANMGWAEAALQPHVARAQIFVRVSLGDALLMRDEAGLLIPLANDTLETLSEFKLGVRMSRPVARAESACLGALRIEQISPPSMDITLQLGCNDFVTLTYQ